MLDFLSIIFFRNSQEMCFYSCQITSLCSLFCNIMLIKTCFTMHTGKSSSPRPRLLRTLRFLFNTDGFGAYKAFRTEACRHIRTHPTKYDDLHEPRKTPEELSAISHSRLDKPIVVYTRRSAVFT